MLSRQVKRYKRHRRVRAKIKGTGKIPRLCVFRSNQHIYAQLIDDEKGRTILSSNDAELKNSKLKTQNSPKENNLPTGQAKPQLKTKNLQEKKGQTTKTGKVVIAFEVGKTIAQKALEKKIAKVVFDRGGYQYHGRVKAVADGARQAGLKF